MGIWGTPIRLDVRPTNPQDSDVSTVDTLRQMQTLVRDASESPLIATVVDSCLRSIQSHPSKREIARAIWYWVKGHVQFVEDEEILANELGYAKDPNQELLIPPVTLLAMPTPMGDCDDYSMLIVSLLKCAHMPAEFVAVAVDKEQPWRYSHVYARTFLDDEQVWMAMDASHGMIPGWETKGPVFRKLLWPV